MIKLTCSKVRQQVSEFSDQERDKCLRKHALKKWFENRAAHGKADKTPRIHIIRIGYFQLAVPQIKIK